MSERMRKYDLQVGDPIFLELGLSDKETNRYVRARLYDENNVEIVGSPFTLSHVNNGLYVNQTLTMPNTPILRAYYEVFTDPGMTIPDNLYPSLYTDTFVLVDKPSINVDVSNLQAIAMDQDLQATVLDSNFLQGEVRLSEQTAQILETNNLTATVRDSSLEGEAHE